MPKYCTGSSLYSTLWWYAYRRAILYTVEHNGLSRPARTARASTRAMGAWQDYVPLLLLAECCAPQLQHAEVRAGGALDQS